MAVLLLKSKDTIFTTVNEREFSNVNFPVQSGNTQMQLKWNGMEKTPVSKMKWIYVLPPLLAALKCCIKNTFF